MAPPKRRSVPIVVVSGGRPRGLATQQNESAMEPRRPSKVEPFPATNTRLLGDARGQCSGDEYEQAWRRLVEAYREPIASTLRRRLRAADDVVVEEFFSYVFDRRVLEGYDSGRGRRFRAYIQVVLQNFLHERRRAVQQGQRAEPTPFELLDGAAASGAALDGAELDQRDEHEWATAVLRAAFGELDAAEPGSARLLTEAYGLSGHGAHDRASLAVARAQSLHALHARLDSAKQSLRKLILAQIRKQCSDQVSFQSELRLLLGRLIEARPNLDFLSEDDSM